MVAQVVISRPAEQSVYKQLRAACLPRIQAFHKDLLLHDRKLIAAHQGTPFLHWTRKTGTHILFLIGADEYPPNGTHVPFLFGTADRQHLLTQAVAMTRLDNGDLVHYFDGQTLRVIDQRAAIEVGREYSSKIRGEWDAESLAGHLAMVEAQS